MTSYLRSIFGGQPAPGSRTHNRSQSSPQTLSYAYGPPPSTAPSTTSTSSRTSSSRSRSFSASRTAETSPLRYATYNASSVRAHNHDNQTQQLHTATPTPPHRRASFKASETALPYPLYTPTVSFSSSRSTSSSSLHPVPLSAPPTAPSRSSSSGNVSYPTRPAFKQAHTWHADSRGATPHVPVSYAQVQRPPTLHMHPLLAYSRLHDAPISYDMTYAPSSRTVLDRTTHTPVPAHTLGQPATDPPTPITSKLVLRSDKFMWPVVVGQTSSSSQSVKHKNFYIASSSSSSNRNSAITNLDVLYALHFTLHTRVTPEEWAALGHGSRSQRKVTKAYENRCTRMGGGWEGGVRRIDWLGRKTRLVGVEVDKSVGMGKLVFGKA